MPGTTIKAALKKFEETTGVKPSEATEIKLIGVYPPIGKKWSKLRKQKMIDRLQIEKRNSVL